MAQYVVVVDQVGTIEGLKARTVDGREVIKAVPVYKRRGQIVELDGKRAEKLVAKGYVKPSSDVDEGELDRPPLHQINQAPNLPANEIIDPAVEPESASLTQKQLLQKEAGELGLDTSGTIAELQARIDEEKKAK